MENIQKVNVAQRRIAAGPEVISDQYGIPVGTLANLRSQRRGPRFYKRGRRVLYYIEDVERWLRAYPVQTLDSMER
ncbi:MAG TPA: hypothetical protein VKF36_05895 [Syntrophorhabdales bacterium]|nr:hypothetical protein [Syntrophorhabdales bacterium]